MTEIPFNAQRLDRLMEAESMDWILATSDHNTRYLLGGYRFFFHENDSAIGVSRYLPVVGYRRGEPGAAFYVAAANESWHLEVEPVWVQRVETAAVTSRASAAAAASPLADAGPVRVGIEPSFLPSDAMVALKAALPHAEFVDATAVLDELRSIKSLRELELLRRASQGIVDSMCATFKRLSPGMSRDVIAGLYRRELT